MFLHSCFLVQEVLLELPSHKAGKVVEQLGTVLRFLRLGFTQAFLPNIAHRILLDTPIIPGGVCGTGTGTGTGLIVLCVPFGMFMVSLSILTTGISISILDFPSSISTAWSVVLYFPPGVLSMVFFRVIITGSLILIGDLSTSGMILLCVCSGMCLVLDFSS